MYTFFSEITSKIKFKLINVYALVGPSGTGKSHNAYSVMEKFKINTIIDDGLLIHNGSILEGISAKNAPNRMEAVRRAIFYVEAHKNSIENALKKNTIQKILIVGTSERMIVKIVQRLGLNLPVKYISIFDITTQEDIKKAKYFRNEENKHIIPVTTVELAKKFSGGIVDYIEHFFRKKESGIKSVVRPTYNVIGKIKISKRVLVKYIYTFFDNFKNVKLVDFSLYYNYDELHKGTFLKVFISVYYGSKISEISSLLQASLKNYIEFYTGLEIKKIDVKINDII